MPPPYLASHPSASDVNKAVETLATAGNAQQLPAAGLPAQSGIPQQGHPVQMAVTYNPQQGYPLNVQPYPQVSIIIMLQNSIYILIVHGHSSISMHRAMPYGTMHNNSYCNNGICSL